MNHSDLMTYVERKATKESFYEFIKSFWNVICTDQYVDNWHIKYLADELQKGAKYVFDKDDVPYKLIINISPGTSKSSIILYLFPVWCWVNDPTARFITTSHSNSLSIKAGVKSRDILQSDKFKRLFPDVKLRRDLSAKTFYQLEAGGSRVMTSKTSKITGNHANFILCDDIADASKANSESDKAQTINHIQAISSREATKGKCFHVYLQQRLADDDATSYLLNTNNKDEIRHINLPAELDDSVYPEECKEFYIDGLFDINRLSRKVLEKKKLELGTRGYSAQFSQKPVQPGGNIVKIEWFNITPSDFNPNNVYHFYIDTAYKEAGKIGANGEPRNDPSGLLCAYYNVITNKMHIVDYQEVYMPITDLCRFIKQWTSTWYNNNSWLNIEPKASGISTIQTLREVTDLNVRELPAKKDSKMVELMNISPKIESGRVVLEDGPYRKLFLERVCGYPFQAHDEAVDVLCYAVNDLLSNNNRSDNKQFIKKINKLL